MPATPLPVLTGRRVCLVPLDHEHVPGLVVAASGDRESFRYTGVPLADRDSVSAYVEAACRARDAGTALPFATMRIGDRGKHTVVGSTRFTAIERWVWPVTVPMPEEVDQRDGPESVEIGSTWLHPDSQRSGINLEAKLLMLTHAFETWKCFRVTLRSDERNAASRASIESLGCRLEAIVRSQMYGYDGAIRNTAQYVMLAEDWPRARERLEARLRRGDAVTPQR